MLLNYNRPVTVSSTLGGYAPNHAVDENMKTYWSAVTGSSKEWIMTDLGEISTVRAVQINYADQNAVLMGKQQGLYHRYRLLASTDGKRWSMVADKSANTKDVPHDYIELSKPVTARYIKMENIHVPTGTFALSGLRVFGRGSGTAPDSVRGLVVLRGDSERRNAWLKWKQSDDADGYVVYWGIAPDKLYLSAMVYGANEYYCTALDKSRKYYFRIEAFNRNGIGPSTTTSAVD